MADIDIGKILEALNSKADVDLNNAQKPIRVNGTLATSPAEDEVLIKAGSESTNEDGGLIVVYGKNGFNAGCFLARAASADGTVRDLIGKPDGSLKWMGYDILRQQNYNKTAYIRFNNGMTLAWGITGGSAQIHTISLPITFSSGNTYAVYTTPFNNGGPFYAPASYEKTGTSFKIRTGGNAENVQIAWLVVGSN